MAAPVCRHEQADSSGNPRFRRQHRRVDPAIDALSSPSRDFRRRGDVSRYGLTRCRDGRGTNGPSSRRFVEPELVPIARCEIQFS
jgi:hypothetical protein